MGEALSWQVLLVVSLIAIGLESIVFNASLGSYYREVRANLVNFFFFLFLSSTFFVVLNTIFRKKTTPYLVIACVTVAISLTLFVIIWLVPPKAQTVPEKSASSSRTPKQKVLAKMVYSAILFLSPALLVVHVHKYRDYYFENLTTYEKFLSRTLPSGQGALAISGEKTGFGQYVDAIQLHFFTNSKMQCVQSDSDCIRLQNLIVGTQSNRVLFLLKILYYFLCLYLIFRYYGRLVELKYKHKPRPSGDLGLQSDVIEQCSHIISISVAFLLSLVLAGVDFSSLGIFAGLIGAGLSVAMKDLLENVVAGVLLLWGKTIKKDDVITIPKSESSDTGATYGVVQRMTMRYTIVEDRNEVRRLIPNSKLTNSTIENWTHADKTVRLRVLVDVDYSTDLRLARTVLESVCYEIPKIDTKKQAPKAVVVGFGDYAIHFALRFWINEPHKGIRPILSDLYIAISERFKEESITIPYPRRDIHIIPPIQLPTAKEQTTEKTLVIKG